MYAYINVCWIQAKVGVRLWLVMCDIPVLSLHARNWLCM